MQIKAAAVAALADPILRFELEDRIRYHVRPNHFSVEQPIRFSHCDPAGIVFFPNYYRLMNDIVEDWFDRGLRIGYADFIERRRHGLPTVAIQSEFVAPGRLGSRLELGLSLVKVGQSSFQLAFEARSDERSVLRSNHTLVVTSLESGSSIPIPPDLREAMSAFMQA